MVSYFFKDTNREFPIHRPPITSCSGSCRENDYIFFLEIFDVPLIQDVIGSRLPHFCDGIIFTPVYAPYMPGTCQGLMKWKPPHLNTIDFAARILVLSEEDRFKRDEAIRAINPDDVPKDNCYVKLCVAQFGHIVEKGNNWAIPSGEFYEHCINNFKEKQEQYKIWECMYDLNANTYKPMINVEESRQKNECVYDWSNMVQVPGGGWKVERIRTDRNIPNDEKVVDKVFKSIQDGLTYDKLIERITSYRNEGKRALVSKLIVADSYSTYGNPLAIRDMTELNKQTKE